MSKLLDVKAELESMANVLKGTTQGEAVKFALKIMQEGNDLRARLEAAEAMLAAQNREHLHTLLANGDLMQERDELRAAFHASCEDEHKLAEEAAALQARAEAVEAELKKQQASALRFSVIAVIALYKYAMIHPLGSEQFEQVRAELNQTLSLYGGAR